MHEAIPDHGNVPVIQQAVLNHRLFCSLNLTLYVEPELFHVGSRGALYSLGSFEVRRQRPCFEGCQGFL